MAKVYWRVPKHIYDQITTIKVELIDSARSNDSLRHEEAKDKLRALPGYPNHNPELDTVHIVKDDELVKIYTH